MRRTIRTAKRGRIGGDTYLSLPNIASHGLPPGAMTIRHFQERASREVDSMGKSTGLVVQVLGEGRVEWAEVRRGNVRVEVDSSTVTGSGYINR